MKKNKVLKAVKRIIDDNPNYEETLTVTVSGYNETTDKIASRTVMDNDHPFLKNTFVPAKILINEAFEILNCQGLTNLKNLSGDDINDIIEYIIEKK